MREREAQRYDFYDHPKSDALLKKVVKFSVFMALLGVNMNYQIILHLKIRSA